MKVSERGDMVKDMRERICSSSLRYNNGSLLPLSRHSYSPALETCWRTETVRASKTV